MAKRKPARARAARTAAKKSTRARAAGTRKSAAKRHSKAAKKKSTKRPSARRTTRKATKKATRQLVARKAAAAKSIKRTAKAKKRIAKTRPAKKLATPAVRARSIAAKPTTPPVAAPVKVRAPRLKRAPTLDRARKTVEAEPHDIPSSLDLDRAPSAARSGRKELVDRLKQHTSTGPALTAGDVDADWEDAESVGDEAPGGDNPTPDQDVVDDIGRALGVEYDDNEELKGGDEIATRDKHRWELDPASSDDYDDRD